MASGDDFGTVVLWDATTLSPVAVVDGHGQPCTALLVLPGGRCVAGFAHGGLQLFSWAERRVLCDVAAHGRPINALAFDPARSLVKPRGFLPGAIQPPSSTFPRGAVCAHVLFGSWRPCQTTRASTSGACHGPRTAFSSFPSSFRPCAHTQERWRPLPRGIVPLIVIAV